MASRPAKPGNITGIPVAIAYIKRRGSVVARYRDCHLVYFSWRETESFAVRREN